MIANLQLTDHRVYVLVDYFERVQFEEVVKTSDYTGLGINFDDLYLGDDLPPTIATSAFYKPICGYCCAQLSQSDYTNDHIVPRKHGGSDHSYNLTPCCRACNSRKSAQLCWKTYDGRFGCYWDGSLGSLIPRSVPRPRGRRFSDPARFVCDHREVVERLFPHSFSTWAVPS